MTIGAGGNNMAASTQGIANPVKKNQNDVVMNQSAGFSVKDFMANSKNMVQTLMKKANDDTTPAPQVAKDIQTFNFKNQDNPIDSKAFLKQVKDPSYRKQLEKHLGE